MSYLDILHKYWGYPDFRGIQREIIESIGAGKDTLGLMLELGRLVIYLLLLALVLRYPSLHRYFR